MSRLVARGELDAYLVDGKLTEAAIEAVRAYVTRDERSKSDDDGDLERRLAVAETRLKEAQAQLREHELAVTSGRYVDRADVERSAADAGRRMLSVLRATPSRVAMALECACRPAAVVEAKIRVEVESAIAEMRDSLLAQAEAAE